MLKLSLPLSTLGSVEEVKHKDTGLHSWFITPQCSATQLYLTCVNHRNIVLDLPASPLVSILTWVRNTESLVQTKKLALWILRSELITVDRWRSTLELTHKTLESGPVKLISFTFISASARSRFHQGLSTCYETTFKCKIQSQK